MWDLPGSGIEPVTAALAGGFFTTESPRKPLKSFEVENANYKNVVLICTLISPHPCSHHQSFLFMPGILFCSNLNFPDYDEVDYFFRCLLALYSFILSCFTYPSHFPTGILFFIDI